LNTIVFDSGTILVEINHLGPQDALMEPGTGSQNRVLSLSGMGTTGGNTLQTSSFPSSLEWKVSVRLLLTLAIFNSRSSLCRSMRQTFSVVVGARPKKSSGEW